MVNGNAVNGNGNSRIFFGQFLLTTCLQLSQMLLTKLMKGPKSSKTVRVCESCMTLPARVSTYDKVVPSDAILALLYNTFLVLVSINLPTEIIKDDVTFCSLSITDLVAQKE